MEDTALSYMLARISADITELNNSVRDLQQHQTKTNIEHEKLKFSLDSCVSALSKLTERLDNEIPELQRQIKNTDDKIFKWTTVGGTIFSVIIFIGWAITNENHIKNVIPNTKIEVAP